MIFFGLGNPGPSYENTRHNIGFMVLDSLAKKENISFHKEKDCLISSFFYKQKKIFLAKPQTFMNLSGQAVKKTLDFYKIPITNIIVIHDDVDLDFLQLKYQKDRGPGGHNGISNIHTHLKTSHYMRLKLGVGKPNYASEVPNFVLSPFLNEEAVQLESLLKTVVHSLYHFLDYGFNKTASIFNGSVEKSLKT